MEMNFLFQAIIYLSAAVLCVPIAKKLGMNSILGYLLAGIIIGPFILGFIGRESKDIMHFAEFGVVMMLFLTGLELETDKFGKIRKLILGMGSLQLIGTELIIFLGCFLFMDWNWKTALVISLALAFFSSVIVLQTLKEKGLANTSIGRSSLSALIFQDMAAIPVLAFLPFLATSIPNTATAIRQSLISGFPSWLQAVIIITIILTIYLGGRSLFISLFKIIARTRLQELFTAAALLLIVSVSSLMLLIGLSPALGTFIAGMVLANSEFHHELESDIAPFKSLLLGLFFISVGASINVKLIMDHAAFIVVFGAIITFIKFSVSFAIGKLYKKKTDQNILFALGLSQAGEFGFVIISIAMQLNIIPAILAGQIMAVIAISMVAASFLQLLNERFIYPKSGIIENEPQKDSNIIDDHNPVIIAGFGHFGSTVGRLLRANNVKTTILDSDPKQINSLRKMGFKAYYGDATRLELLEAAGCANAKLFIVAIDDPKVNLRVIRTLKQHYPNLKILTRARNRIDAYELIDHKVDHIYRETLYSAVNMGIDILVELGHRKYSATRQGQQFIKHDEITTRKLAQKRYNKKTYMSIMHDEIKLEQQILKSDAHSTIGGNSHSWDSEYLKKKVRSDLKK